MATTYPRKHSRKQSKRRSRTRKSKSKKRSRKLKSRSKKRSRRRKSRSRKRKSMSRRRKSRSRKRKSRSRKRKSRSKTRLRGGVKRSYPSILRKPKQNLKNRDNIIWVDTAIVKRPIARKTIAIPQPPSPPKSNVPRKLSRKLF
jgi:hypothetical protein